MPRVVSVSFTAQFQKRHLYLEGSSKKFADHAKSIENMRHGRGYVISKKDETELLKSIRPEVSSTVIRADSDESLRSLEQAILAEMDATIGSLALAPAQKLEFSINLPDHENVYYNYFEGNKYKRFHKVPVHNSTHVRLGGKLTSNGNGDLHLEINHLASTSENYSYKPLERSQSKN